MHSMADPTMDINAQALAVLALLSHREPDFAEYKDGEYQVKFVTRPWYNGRERGVCFSMARTYDMPALNISVFEHRNSDSLCAVKWISDRLPIDAGWSVQDIPDSYYPNKWAVKDFGYLGVKDCVEWMIDNFTKHYGEGFPRRS